MTADARSRLCPEHRHNSLPTSSCVACAQARRIAELEQTVKQVVELNERLAERVKKLEAVVTPQRTRLGVRVLRRKGLHPDTGDLNQ